MNNTRKEGHFDGIETVVDLDGQKYAVSYEEQSGLHEGERITFEVKQGRKKRWAVKVIPRM